MTESLQLLSYNCLKARLQPMKLCSATIYTGD